MAVPCPGRAAARERVGAADSTHTHTQVKCLLRHFANGVTDPAGGMCGAHPSQRPSSWVVYLAIVVTAGQGLCAWVAFGTSKKLYTVRLRLRGGLLPPPPLPRCSAVLTAAAAGMGCAAV